MAKSKKTSIDKVLNKAASRDRKRISKKRMAVSGKSVFSLVRLVGTRARKKAR